MMNPTGPAERGYQSRLRTGNIRLAAWNGAWVVTCFLMGFGPKYFWNKASLFTLLAIGLNVCVGAGLILANKKYIMALDELQRKVFLNALALAAGVAVIIGVPYSVMDSHNVIPFAAKIDHLVMLMSLTFFVSFVYGNWRYR